MLKKKNVAIIKTKYTSYPKDPPYSPHILYPELSSQNIAISKNENHVYNSLRHLLYFYGLDKENFGTTKWNPFGEFVKSGQKVILKPNFVSHFNHAKYIDGTTDMDCVVTHSSIIRFVLDYVALALKGEGKIIITDCPIQGTSWDDLIKIARLDLIIDEFKKRNKNIDILIKDFRLGKAKVIGKVMISRSVDYSKISEYYEIDLGNKSLLCPLMNGKYEFGVSQYPKHRMKAAHTPETNKYLIPKDVIDADFFVNLPKFKSHMKSGITCALKNFVGIIGHKDYLPHFRYGSPKEGGDEYPDGDFIWDLMWWFYHQEWELDRGIRKLFYIYIAKLLNFFQVLFMGKERGFARVGGGSWYGNDTLWRTILDINRAFFYFDSKINKVDNEIKRNYFCLVDGLVGGHKESPLAPHPINAQFFICGQNPVAIDYVSAVLMGFDYDKIPLLKNAFNIEELPLAVFGKDNIEYSLYDEINDKLISGSNIDELYSYAVKFEPSMGFKNKIEKGFK